MRGSGAVRKVKGARLVLRLHHNTNLGIFHVVT